MDVTTTLITLVGIATPAVWAAWTFQRLQSVRAAEADLNMKVLSGELTRTEIATAERQRVSEQPNLEISFAEVTEHRHPGTGAGCLAVAVCLRNSGLRNLMVYFDRASLAVGLTEPSGKASNTLHDVFRARPAYLPARGSTLEQMPNRVFRAGQSRQVAFVAPVHAPGIYLLQFEAVYHAVGFEGEPESDEQPWVILAVEQSVVAVTSA